MGHLRADPRIAVSPPPHLPPRRRSGGRRAVLIIVLLVLAEVALVRGTFAADEAITPPPAPIPQNPLPGRGLTALKAPDPTAGTLPPTTLLSLAAEANARTTLRIDGDPSGNRYTRGLAASTIGQVFSSSSLELCSATVIESPSERVAVTAAHCVY